MDSHAFQPPIRRIDALEPGEVVPIQCGILHQRHDDGVIQQQKEKGNPPLAGVEMEMK